jgi:hypothetical protein
MSDKFHQRFNIEVPLETAKSRFVARVGNEIFETGPWMYHRNEAIRRAIATTLGEHNPPLHKSIVSFVGGDFYRTLQALEGIYSVIQAGYGEEYDATIFRLLRMSEVDLEVSWQNGKFHATGAKELDDALVNDVLVWLRNPIYVTVRQPFEKSLDHLLRARAKPELLSDVITDAYEALEALAKIVTGKDQGLDAIQNLFLKQISASEEYTQILNECLKKYRPFAHKFRHGAASPEKRPSIGYAETESFVYLTGLFIRLVVSSGFGSDATA